MKLLMIITLLLSINTIQAEIFKCETKEGEVKYQDAKCTKSSHQKKVVVTKINHEITRKAQVRLKEELEQHENYKKTKMLNDEKIRKDEEREAQLDATWAYHNALERNTEAREQRNRQRYYNNYTRPFILDRRLGKGKKPQKLNLPRKQSSRSNMNPP